MVRVNPRPAGSISSDPLLEACYYGTTGVQLDVPVSFPVGEPPFTIYYHDGYNPGTISGFSLTTGTFPVDLASSDSTRFTIVLDSLLDNKGCWSHPDSTLPGTATATVFRYPVPVSSSDTVTACDNEVVLPVTGGVGEGTWGPASGDYSFAPAALPGATFMTSFTNDTLFYTVVWSEQNGICPVNDTSVILVLELYQEPDPAFAGTDSTIFFAGSTNLWADSVTAGTGTWMVSGTAVMDPSQVHLHNALVELGSSDLDETVDNTFTWTVQNGICTPTQSSVLVTRQDIRLYSGFSPDNGDLINQYFELPGLEFADEFTLAILSRQGLVVRTISKAAGEGFQDPDMWWDGLMDNGQQAPDGTYFYILAVKHAGQTYEYKGFVELVRTPVN